MNSDFCPFIFQHRTDELHWSLRKQHNELHFTDTRNDYPSSKNRPLRLTCLGWHCDDETLLNGKINITSVGGFNLDCFLKLSCISVQTDRHILINPPPKTVSPNGWEIWVMRSKESLFCPSKLLCSILSKKASTQYNRMALRGRDMIKRRGD